MPPRRARSETKSYGAQCRQLELLGPYGRQPPGCRYAARPQRYSGCVEPINRVAVDADCPIDTVAYGEDASEQVDV